MTTYYAWRRAVVLTTVYVVVALGPALAVRWGRDQGLDFSGVIGTAVVAALLLTSVVGLAQLVAAVTGRRRSLTTPPLVPPSATAIVAAYLPNEVDVVVATLRHLLDIRVPQQLQVILAYNTPEDLPVEAELTELARREPRLLVLRVRGSRSKAANVNAAAALATGVVVGVFDADHRPQADVFARAWAHLVAGADVVQGQCVVRDGHRSKLARAVAVEFAGSYGIVHPGRRRLFDLGVFGGSNGYWRAETLRAIPFDENRLTEDIDASLRVVRAHGHIEVDPNIVSTELAPRDLTALMRQRRRWAQGWFEVGLNQYGAVRAAKLPARVRFGAWWLFCWCPMVPWVGLMAPALLVDRIITNGWMLTSNAMFVTLVLATTVSGPAQILAAWHAAPKEVRVATWFAWSLINGVLLALLRDHASRTGQIGHVLGDRRWLVTPRQVVEEPQLTLTTSPIAA